MTTSTTKPLTFLVGLALTIGLVLSACGSSDDGANQPVADAGAEDAAPELEPAEAEAEAETEAAGEPASEPEPDPGPEPSVEEDVAGDGAEAVVSVVDSAYLDSYSLMDEAFGTMVTVTVADGTRTIVTNALPDHETGEFPNAGNPNTITEQDLTWAFPTEALFTGDATGVRTSGVAVNGVKFEPGTAETVTCDSGETFRIEALQDVYDLGFDFNNAHVQPGGEYHYHGISALLVDAYDTDDDLVHIGFAADGYLMYYSKSGSYDSSFVLTDVARSGSGCVASGPGGTEVDIAGTAPDGTYTSDFEFVDGAGDLDSCNGTTVDGQYVYIVTDTFPYVSRCLNGDVSGSGDVGGGGAGGAAPGGGGAPAGPDFSDAAAELGVSEEALLDALGEPPFDLDAAADVLGVTAAQLEAVLPPPPG